MIVRGPRPVTPVSIAADKLDHISEQLDRLNGVDPDVIAELRQARELVGGLDPYLRRSTTPESPALRDLAHRTAAEDWTRRSGGAAPALEQEMLSGHVEGQTLKFLVHATRARRVLEIGMFTGYSALAMAEALPDDGEVIACEIDGDVATFARQSFEQSPDGRKISVRVGPALTTLDELASAGDEFDVVFVDADKASYAAYLEKVLDSDLLASDGVICVDNTLLQGQPYIDDALTPNGAAIAEFNRAVARDPRVEQVLLPLRDGLTLIRRV